jgi:hypothetical protein
MMMENLRPVKFIVMRWEIPAGSDIDYICIFMNITMTREFVIMTCRMSANYQDGGDFDEPLNGFPLISR